MPHEMNPDCISQFVKITANQEQILAELNKLTTAVFGNGKSGLREDTKEIRQDLKDLHDLYYELDRGLENIEEERKEEKKIVIMDKKEKSREILKFILAAALALLAVIFSTAQTLLIYKLIGQLP
jgi:hypothetical protein